MKVSRTGASVAANLKQVNFTSNYASGGGAVACQNNNGVPTQIIMDEVLFQGNTARDTGGALFVSTGCTARLIGKSTLIANKALGTSTPGGAVAVYSQLDIAGPLCAQDNHASAPGGGFLTAYRLSVVTFSDPATANVNGNTPRDIVIFGGVPFGDPPGRILCGSSLTSWVGGTSFVGYTITGQVCACDEAFSNGTTTTCTSCPLGWSTSICACECTTGACCNEGEFTPAGVLCRRPTGSCERSLTCTGDNADCPENLFPDGARCRYSAQDQYQDTFWSKQFRPLVADRVHRDGPNSLETSPSGNKPTGKQAVSTHYPEHRHPSDDDDGYHPVDLPRHSPDDNEHFPRYDPDDDGHYPAYHPRYNHDDEEPAYGDWPECVGTCFDGKCDLHKPHRGCC